MYVVVMIGSAGVANECTFTTLDAICLGTYNKQASFQNRNLTGKNSVV